MCSKHHYLLLSRSVSSKLQPERTIRMRPLCLSLTHVPVTINVCCSSMAFPSAWHSLVLSLPSIAVTCVLKAVISTLCSIATMSSPLLYFSQFSQACGCLSVEADSPVIWFSCLPPCCSATTFWLQWDISLSISASARLCFLHYLVLVLLYIMNKHHPSLKDPYSIYRHTCQQTLHSNICFIGLLKNYRFVWYLIQWISKKQTSLYVFLATDW